MNALRIAVLLVAALPLFAVTAGDYLQKMNDDQRFGFINGALDTFTYLAVIEGKPQKASCIVNWYFKSEGTGPRDVVAAFDKYRDKPAVAIIRALIKKQCGE